MKFIEGLIGILAILFAFMFSVLMFKIYMFVANSIKIGPLALMTFLLGITIMIFLKINDESEIQDGENEGDSNTKDDI